MSKKKYLPFIIPIVSGIIIGACVLILKPNTGKHLGDVIYSSGVSLEGYSYAVNKAAPSVVNIYVANMNDDYTEPDNSSITSSASGVIMSRNIIVTNYHVVTNANENNKSIWVQTRDGKVFQAFVVGADRRTDIAVLRVDNASLQPISISKVDPKIGDIVLAIGNPNNLGQTVTHGIISALSRSGTGLLSKDKMNIREGIQELIQTDAPINQGNSGGALINTQGNLVGINTASFSAENTYGIGFSVPVKMVQSVTDEIIRHGKVVRGYLGISDDEKSSITNSNEGVKIGFIDPQGPAFGILKVGDIITKVNDINIPNVRTLIDLISQSKPGSELIFEIKRDGNLRKETITLAEDSTSYD